ncbi:MAG: DUF2079 domain-containing protein [Candidatus Niyogibacteria bacterium]|nr:DUF2079 domain-containing protein [Candidatus Niyogibacteria bacterium]
MSAPSSKILLGVFIAAYILVFGTLTLLRHADFQTQAWDMGIFQQTFWNTIHGRVMQNTIEEIPNHLGIHMSPLLFLLVPGFALFPSPYYLLVIQTLALALGAIPAYLLALHILKNRRLALFFAGAYLLYPPLHWVNWFDFHEIAFFVPLALGGLYFLEQRRWGWAWIFLILAASTKEDAILAVAAIGFWLFVKKYPLSTVYPPKGLTFGFLTKERIHGALLLTVMLGYFIIATKLIMPALGGGLVRLDRYAELGETSLAIVKNLLLHPSLLIQTVITVEKINYVFWLLASFAFLPLAAGRALILAAPGFLENLLTAFKFQFSSFYQYDAILIPALLVASLYGFDRLRVRWPKQEKVFASIFLIIVGGAFVLRSPIGPLSFPTEFFRANPHRDAYRAMIREVPNEASVAAYTNLIPHLSNREHVYMLGQEPFTADVILLDGGDYFGFPDPKAFQIYADSYALSELYDIRIIDERYFIFTRKNFSQ